MTGGSSTGLQEVFINLLEGFDLVKLSFLVWIKYPSSSLKYNFNYSYLQKTLAEQNLIIVLN